MSSMIGKRFGRLIVLGASDKPRFLNCLCDCGTKRDIRMDHLTSGATISCGCFRREFSREQMRKIAKPTHKKSGTVEHRAWLNLKYRCSDASKRSVYADRGIMVCQGYADSFERFFADVGNRPPGDYSIDRIDNDGGYWCGKCEECLANGWTMNIRWATASQQVQNSRTVTESVAELARRAGLNPNTVRVRMFRGQTLDEALSPLKFPRR